MKLQDLKDLEFRELCSLLREEGVSELRCGDIVLVLGQPPYSPPAIGPAESSSEPLLPCGHAQWEGNERGECYHGCIPPPLEE